MALPTAPCIYPGTIVAEALKRWNAASAKRVEIKDALAKGEFHKVEPAERMAKRVNRVVGIVKQRLGSSSLQFASPELREVMAAGPVNEDNVTDLLLERVIGETRDLLQIDFFARGQAVSRRIGRIATKLPGNRVSYGTGFLIAPGLMMTNWHVLETRDDATRSQLQLDYQGGFQPQTFNLAPEIFFHSNRQLDFAIVHVKEVSDRGASLGDYGWCPLVGSEGKISIGEPVNIIQHPLGELKQVTFRENKLLDLEDSTKIFAYYEADTEQGSSGSSVFNDQWEVVALHHSGVPKTNSKGEWLKKDGSIFKKGDDPRAIHWIANEGIRVSALVSHLKSLNLSDAEMKQMRLILDAKEPLVESTTKALVAPQSRRTIQGSTTVRAQEPRTNTPMTVNNVFNFYGDTQVFVGGAQALQPSDNDTVPRGRFRASASKPGPPQELGVGAVDGSFSILEKITPDPFTMAREGYDRAFLGKEVALPQPVGTAAEAALKVDGADADSPFELRYHRHSIIMNGDRKLAFIAAVNYDPTAQFSHPREKGGDRWFFDERIGKEFQLGPGMYASNPLDRGHLARRNDAGWGDTKDEAKACSDDTFFFTNCSPQHEIFNQSTLANKAGVLLWGNIEDHVMKQGQANARRLTIFNGPIFRDNDRSYREGLLPREYWKIVAFADENGQLRAAAFKLSQESLITGDALKEKIDFEPYEAFQVRIASLADETGLDFSNLIGIDTAPPESTDESFVAGARRVSRLADITL